ncbi:MAG: class IV adenylate cyclase [Nanoarchaeota archaeon]|nr:class IV adenylate cyclase [Nanoarchaeota archaeon]MBU1644496.1 class IV adenylate cyclase [Nanoarchaeota archaeon]MBU1976500.1 class IV adenylate cyclase [Nanoarchaeota archaeon]
MKEIEVKILDIDVPELIRKLQELGAEKVFEGEITAVFFDFPSDQLEKEGKSLRVRKLGEKVELCLKGKKEKSRFKVREELEVTTNNFEDTLAIFEKLRFKKRFEGRKRRESYQLNKIKIEIDTYPGIPTFFEVEAPSEEEVVETVKKLGFTEEQMSNISVKELFRIYNKKYE